MKSSSLDRLCRRLSRAWNCWLAVMWARGSLSWAALLALPPSLKRCSRAGLPSSRSLWCCCTRCATLIWWLPSFAHALPSPCHSHLSSLPRQPSLLECRLYYQRGFGVHPGGASDWLVLAEGLPPQQSRWFSTCRVPRSMPLPLSCRLPRSPRSWWGECWHVTPVLPPLQRPPLLPCPSLHHPGQTGPTGGRGTGRPRHVPGGGGEEGGDATQGEGGGGEGRGGRAGEGREGRVGWGRREWERKRKVYTAELFLECVYMCTCMCMCVRLCVYMYVYMYCMCVCMYVYMCAHTHTHHTHAPGHHVQWEGDIWAGARRPEAVQCVQHGLLPLCHQMPLQRRSAWEIKK